MAKKRLNKKLIGILSLVAMAILVVAVIVVIQYKFRDPRPFMEEAYRLVREAQAAQARSEAEVAGIEDPKERHDRLRELKAEGSDELWREAMENLGQVMRYARSNQQLRREAQKELAKLYGDIRIFQAQRDVWKRMFEENAGNYDAKKKLVEYDYTVAQSGVASRWPELYGDAQVLIELNEQQDLKDSYGYVVRAHACLAMILAKLEQNPLELKAEGLELLEKALACDENSLEAYRLLGRFKDLEGDEARSVEEREKFRQEAEGYFVAAIEHNPQDATAYVHYLEDHLYRRVMFKYNTSQRFPTREQRAEALDEARQFVQERVIPVLDKARREFPENAELAAYDGRIARVLSPGMEGLDGAIERYEEAVALDRDDDRLYVRLADYYRRRGEQKGDDREDMEAAFEVLWRCLYLPDTADPQGAEYRRHVQRRMLVLRSLVEVCSKLVAGSEAEERDRYLRIATESAKDLSDRLGDEHIWSRVATGTALLAGGKRDDGVRYLYLADKERDATGRPDGDLKLKLFEALRDTEYRTLAMDYAEQGLRLVSYSPTIIPRYMRTMLTVPGREMADRVLSLADNFEQALAASGREVSQEDRDELALIRAQAYLRQEAHAKMREVLATVERDDLEVRVLRARAHDTPAQRMAGLEELVKEDYGQLFMARPLLRYYLTMGREDPSYYEKGRQLAARVLEVQPDNFFVKEMSLILGEPDPGAVGAKQLKEFRLAVRQEIADPYERNMALAAEYKGLAAMSEGADDPEAAAEYWSQCRASYEAAAADSKDIRSLSGLFDLAIMQKDWQRAEELVPRVAAVDPHIGILSEGHLKAAQAQWDDAADRLEKYLQVRPISVLGHLGLGQVYSARGQLDKAIAEVKLAVAQDSTHMEANRLLLQLLHQRNNDIGLDNLTSSQLADTILPLDASLSRNPSDILARRLQVIYYPLWVAQQRERTAVDPDLNEAQRKAAGEQMDRVMGQVLTSCRGLISMDPNNPQNWVVYAAVVHDEAKQNKTPERKKELLDSAAEIYRAGLAQNPTSTQLALQYDMFLEETGVGEQAGRHLAQLAQTAQGDAKDRAQIQLARLYRRQHKYEQARAQLLEVLDRNSENLAARTSLSELAAIQGKYAEAIENIGKAREVKDSLQLLSRHAELLTFAGEMDQADKLVDKMREDYPDAPVTNLVAGRMAMFRLDYAAAEAYAEKVLATNADNVGAHLLKSEALYKKGELVGAMECLVGLRALVGADNNAGRELLSVVYWQLSRYDDAIGELFAAARVNPRDKSIRERLVNMLKSRSRWEQLEQFYQEMIELEPDAARWYVESGEVALARATMLETSDQDRMRAGLYIKAINLTARGYKMAKESGSEQEAAVALRSLIKALIESRQWKRVRKLLDEQLVHQPDNVLLLSAKAEALYQLRDEAGALQALDKAVASIDAGSGDTLTLLEKLDDIGDLKRLERWATRKLGQRRKWATMQLILGMIYSAQGEFGKQVTLLEEALAGGLLEDQELPAQRALMVGYGRSGREDDAVALGRELSEKGVRDVGILNNLAYMLMEMGGHEEEAVALAGRAYSLAGSNVNIMDTYAMALMATKDFARAELIMRQAIGEHKNTAEDVPAEFYYHHAQALVGLGRTLEARTILIEQRGRLSAPGADKKELLMFEPISALLDQLTPKDDGEAARQEPAPTGTEP